MYLGACTFGSVCLRAFVCVHACVRACVCVRGRVRVHAFVRACGYVCRCTQSHVCIRLFELEREEFHLFDELTCVCAHALVRVRAARASVHACVRERVSE